MCRAAHVYGYFVPVSTWVPFVSQRLLSQATYTDLMVVSHIINGSDPMLLRGHLDDLALVLQDDTVCLTSNVSNISILIHNQLQSAYFVFLFLKSSEYLAYKHFNMTS